MNERERAAERARRYARADKAWNKEIAKAHNVPGRLTYPAAARLALAAFDREYRRKAVAR